MADNDPRVYPCTCGKRFCDTGELGDHIIDALLDDPESSHGHGRGAGPEPERVGEIRVHVDRKLDLRRQLADAVGMSFDELREALRG
jgi:hypothetical protein